MKKFLTVFFQIVLMLVFITGCGNETSKNDSENLNDNETPDESFEDLFEEPVLNPSGNIPLSAGINLKTDNISKVVVLVKDIDEITKDFEKEYVLENTEKTVSVPVLGLFPDHENIVVVKAFDSKGDVVQEKEFKIQTAKLPKNFPVIELEGKIESGWTIVNWLFTPRERPEMSAIAVDQSGRIRWYTDFPYAAAFPITIHDGFLYTSNGETTLYKYDFMGFEIEKWDVSEHGYTKIHHDIVIKDDGNILIAVSKIDDPWINDRVIEINPANNQLRGTWDLKKTFPDVCDLFHDVPLTAGSDPAGQANDSVHQNAIWYNNADDSIIIGSQRSGVAKMTHSGYLKWFLAPHIVALIDDADSDGISDSLVDGYNASDPLTRVGDYEGDKYVQDRMPIAGKPHEDYSAFDFRYQEFFLTPVDKEGKEITDIEVLKGFKTHEDFAWPSRPHTPSILKNGNLMVFDNGLSRNFSYPPVFNDHYSRAVEYEIVPDKKDGYGGTIRQVWEYVLEADPMWYAFSPVVSGTNELENGNRLIVSGSVGTSFYPDQLKMMYGDGPVGALIIEVNPTDNSELNRMFFERYVDDEWPNTQFSAYRAYRFELSASVR